MQKHSIGAIAALFVFLLSDLVIADGDSIGIIPGKLAWSVDSIVEQWTLTKDVDGETIEQTLYDFSSPKSDDDHNVTPVDQRYNRQLVITLSFINLGSETYRFDNSSRLEAFIKSGSKTIRADAQPMTSKTIIAPNGRVKKCSFVIKMNNRAFVEAFDKRASINELSINPVSGKLLIENPKGDSILDNVEQPGKISFYTEKYIKDISVFPEPDNEFTLKDALLAFNKMSSIITEGKTLYKEVVSITDNQIDSVFGIPVNKPSNFMGSNVELPWLVVFMLNEDPVDNYKTADVLSKQFRSKDEFKIGVIPTDMLNQYLPLDETYLLLTFGKCIEKLPESIVPKRYLEVNVKSFIDMANPFKILKEYAESGDNEAIEVILKLYDPKKHDGFLYELFPDSKSLFLWLKQLADKGYSQAQLSVGLFYDNGIIVKENPDKALKYFKLSAEQDNDVAMVCYANLLYRKDSNKYKDEFIEWYRKAAERKNLRGQYLLSIILLGSPDKEQKKEGIMWLQQSAFAGYPEAMFDLALEYYVGRIIPRDEKKAFSLMENAALDKGLIRAFDVLGDFYLQGIGVERDGKRAVLCYSVGAKNGVPNSLYWYGRFLIDGFNVEKDVQKGYQLIKEAAERGHSDAMMYIGLDFYLGAIAKKNYKEAFSWIEKAANKDDFRAMTILGDFYMDGIGVDEDIEKALRLYKLSAESGDALGMFRWGKLLYEQKGVDAQKGLDYIKAAVKMGDESAKEYLDKLNSANGGNDNDFPDDDSEDLFDDQDDNDNNDLDDDDDIDDLDDEDPFA